MDRPQVSLVGSSLPPPPDDEPVRAPRSRRAPLVVAVALLLLVLGARGGDGADEPEPAGPGAELLLRADALTVTQGGVLVLPLELRNPGERLAVRSARVFASPVGTDPSVQAPQEVGAGDRRRFVALVAPDCPLLRASGAAFSAGVLIEVGRGSADEQLVLDLAADPVVAARVASLCG